jgi:hypothetical protein
MSNPWLGIPLTDYEGHMSSPEVQQLTALSDLFAEALVRCRPASIAILGIAGGNGLDRIDTNLTKRVVALDINPLYLEAVQSRYPHLTGLELHCIDLAEQDLHLPPVDLVHAALVFEHAGLDRCLENALALLAAGGTLSVVLQLPTETAQSVGASPFTSMQSLKSHFSLVDPVRLCKTLQQRKLHLQYEAKRPIPSGKGFWMGLFHRK